MKQYSATYNPNGYYGIFNDSFPPIYDGVTLTVENYVKGLIDKRRLPCVVTPWNPEHNSFPYKVIKYFSLPIPSSANSGAPTNNTPVNNLK